MKPVFSILLPIVLLAGCMAQTDDVGPSTQPTLLTDDTGIPTLLNDLYSSIEYDGVEMPDWDIMRSLFMEGAWLVPVTDTTYTRWSVDEFIETYEGQIEDGLVHTSTEYEVFRTGDLYANIAQVFSTYELMRVTREDTVRERGINSIQLMRQEGRWYITSIIWYDENESHPLPNRYLPPEAGE